MSYSTQGHSVRGQSRRAQILNRACLESLEQRQYLANSPLVEVLPAIPGAQGGLTDVTQGAGGGQSLSLGESRTTGVRYYDGNASFTASDFVTQGFGMPWGQVRTWNSVVGYATDNNTHNGSGWFDAQLPYLVETTIDSTAAVAIVLNGKTAEVFKLDDDDYVAQNFDVNTLQHFDGAEEGDPGKYILTDSNGNQITFQDFASEDESDLAANGSFMSFTDPYGNVTAVAYRDEAGRATDITRTTGTVTEDYLYSYVSDGVNEGLLESVTFQRTVGGGDPTTIREVDYTYYGTSDRNGMPGDLKTATLTDGNGAHVIDREYYRYYAPSVVSSVSHVGTSAHVNFDNHDFSDGDLITISGSDVAQFNGTFVITKDDDDNFEYTMASTPASNPTTAVSATGPGYEHGLKIAFSARSTARLIASYGSYQSELDSTIAPYADRYYTYYTSGADAGKVKTVAVQGTGASANDGIGTYSYTYYSNPSESTVAGHGWNERTIETQPDTSTNTYYTNGIGQVLVRSFAPSDGGNTNRWVTGFQYSSNKSMTIKAMPSAMTLGGGSVDLVIDGGATYSILSDAGLVYHYGDSSSPQGGGGVQPKDFSGDTGVSQGSGGDITYLTHLDYVSHSYTPSGQAEQTIYKVAHDATLPFGTSGAGDESDRVITYTWDSGMSTTWHHFQPAFMIESRPGNDGLNGSSDPDSTTTYFDTFGRAEWVKDPEGHLSYTAYDDSTGAVTKQIVDVNTDTVHGGDYSDKPSGWTNTSGLHLKTLYGNDDLGRITSITEPAGNSTYIVYDDVDHESRTYPGWSNGSHTTKGPITVRREDRDHGYVEVITMSATPAYGGDDLPTGGESIGSLETLSRTYRSTGGQALRSDRYFHLSGVSYGSGNYIGTVNTDYYTTAYAFDARGRRYRTTMPTGTIYQTNFDELSRPITKAVGIDANALTTTKEYFYDGGADVMDTAGNGVLTKVVQHLGGGTPDRNTLMYYDWRDRRMAIKFGGSDEEDDGAHRLIQYTDYDLLSEPVVVYTYAGDEIAVSVEGDGFTVALDDEGVATKPSSSLLRAKSTTDYDNQARVYATHLFGVDPDNGAIGSNIDTNYFYDHRGNVIEILNPGGLVTKSTYDGANRLSKTYQTDGGGDSGWSTADDVTGDFVYTQTETQYDDNGNPNFWIKRDHFHGDTVTGGDAHTGELGNPASSGSVAKARVYYSEAFYDGADRLTNFVDVGTNGGSGYSLDTTLPARSPDVLRTDYDYNSAGWNDVITDPREIETHYTYDNAARLTKTIENYVNGTMETSDSTEGDDRTTEYLYDGDDHVTSMKADLVSGHQETQWIYGEAIQTVSSLTRSSHTVTVTTSSAHGFKSGELVRISGADQTDYDGDFQIVVTSSTTFTFGITTSAATTATGTIKVRRGNDVQSNDILSAIRFPDKSSGSASTSEQESYEVDELGEVKEYTDRNGTVHDYTYDSLGRRILDSVSTFGSGVDDAVVALGVSYNDAGLPEFFTSYDALTPVNQVQRVYNGFGQVTDEFQEHDGVVDGDTTEVQYAYTFSNNDSLLQQITYPDAVGIANGARHLTYFYDSISRATDIKWVTAAYIGHSAVVDPIESYDYLGLDTIIQRRRPEGGTFPTTWQGLTYLQQSGDTVVGDGGDQYKGLDRFGRVVEQRWMDHHFSGGVFTDTDLDYFIYTYDEDGNVTSRDNPVHSGFDETYAYDGLNRLTEYRQGDISSGSISSPTHSLVWDLDALGNWKSLTTDGGSPASRTINKQNQITGTHLVYDSNGNTLEAGSALPSYKYDAWNRITFAALNLTPTLDNHRYTYDALGRQLNDTKHKIPPEAVTQLYYSTSGQVLLEQTETPSEGEGEDLGAGGGEESMMMPMSIDPDNTTITNRYEYVWGIDYVNDLVIRDKDATANGSYEQRLFVQHDANFDVTSITSTAAAVNERYIYDPYGERTILHGDWSSYNTTGGYGWTFNFQGGRRDAATGLTHFGARDVNSTTGRWMQQDYDGGYVDGGNLYEVLGSDPINWVDPLGQGSIRILVPKGKVQVVHTDSTGGAATVDIAIGDPKDGSPAGGDATVTITEVIPAVGGTATSRPTTMPTVIVRTEHVHAGSGITIKGNLIRVTVEPADKDQSSVTGTSTTR